MSILLIAAGLVGIASGVFGKKFYEADILSVSVGTRKSSTWSGRLIFIVAGTGLIAVGIKLLVSSN
jgi:hypothetical protein